MSIYGSIISIAVFISTLIVEDRVKKDGKNKELVWGLLLAIIIPTILGARLYHIISMWQYYIGNPDKILMIWNGGLALWGGLTGGFIGTYFYLKHKKENIAYWLDQIALVLPLGQAIGRFGNYFNQELYGKPTTVPWAIYIEPAKRLPGLESFNTFHPLFLYETILNIILFIFLNIISKKYKSGTKFTFYSYLIGYSSIRFVLEYIRPVSWSMGNLNVSQLVCVCVFTTSVILMRRHL